MREIYGRRETQGKLSKCINDNQHAKYLGQSGLFGTLNR